jgi:hypothetical protein
MSAATQAPKLAANLHALRHAIAAEVESARLHATIIQAILALFDHIFDALERLVADWAAGRLPPLSQRRATPRPAPPRPDTRRPATAHQPRPATARPHRARHAPRPAGTTIAPRTHAAPHDALAPRHPPAPESPTPKSATPESATPHRRHHRAHPPPPRKTAAWTSAPWHALFITISK